MKQYKINKIYCLIFVIIISLPLILLILRIKIDDPYSTKKINANFTKNFPLKQDYFGIYYQIKENIFKRLPFPEKVFKLDGGWYFLGDKDSNNLSESKGFLLFTKNEIERLVENLTYKRDWCKKNKIDYIMTIAPNKESVYGNLIPILQFGTNKKMIQLDSICKSLGIKFVDLGKQIPNNQKMISYHKADTHWNHYGAYFGYKEFIEKMNLWYPNKSIEIPFPLYSYNFEKRWDENVGDLKHMANEKRGAEIIVLVNKNGEKAKITNQIIKPKYKIFVDPKEYEFRFIAPVKNNIKIVFLRDSFCSYLLHYFKEHFKESVFIYQRDFDLHLLKKEKPEFIVEEIVERDIDLLIDETQENIINK
jgi:hypothetical protein